MSYIRNFDMFEIIQLMVMAISVNDGGHFNMTCNFFFIVYSTVYRLRKVRTYCVYSGVYSSGKKWASNYQFNLAQFPECG